MAPATHVPAAMTLKAASVASCATVWHSATAAFPLLRPSVRVHIGRVLMVETARQSSKLAAIAALGIAPS